MRAGKAVPALINALFSRNPKRKSPFAAPFQVVVPRTYIDEHGNIQVEYPEPEPHDEPAEFLTNDQALAALRAITRQDFDYDKDKWKTWWNANKKTIPDWPEKIKNDK
jgi:hypothetical protein